jgi:hypothetical protein
MYGVCLLQIMHGLLINCCLTFHESIILVKVALISKLCYHSLHKDYVSDYEQIEVRECLLLFGAETFVFQFAIQKFKD